MTTEWISSAEVHFRAPGQFLGEQNAPQVRASGDVRLVDGWLHLKLPNDGGIVSVPASAVDRVHWRPATV
ncbi:hypothetical protein [Streptacidiphilus rugosus]|uniref:hypothetical protein n=1 Tax=Streptacidiphilus rugosus TaxID=405783 RepID=UPI0005634621|nr:hypothetical protein [Streptacidiphilus rugosus]